MSRRRRRFPRASASPPSSTCPTLDLHGETAETARRLTERWLRQRQAEGIDLVRVVTGRGLHSVGGPVLPGEIRELLEELRGSVVADFFTERGEGSLQVTLRPPFPTRRSREDGFRSASSPGAVPAEVRRAAEEALSELGVRPTPALLEAEIRRLLTRSRPPGA